MSLAASAEIAGSQYLPLLPSSWPQKVLKVAGQRHEQCLSGKLGPFCFRPHGYSTTTKCHPLSSIWQSATTTPRTETYRAIMSYQKTIGGLALLGKTLSGAAPFCWSARRRICTTLLEAVAIALKVSKSVTPSRWVDHGYSVARVLNQKSLTESSYLYSPNARNNCETYSHCAKTPFCKSPKSPNGASFTSSNSKSVKKHMELCHGKAAKVVKLRCAAGVFRGHLRPVTASRGTKFAAVLQAILEIPPGDRCRSSHHCVVLTYPLLMTKTSPWIKLMALIEKNMGWSF